MSPRTTQILRLAAGALALGAALPMTGCRGDRSDNPPRQFFPDMDDQPRWKPQSESQFYADGRTMRQPVDGTVPFGTTYVISDDPWALPFNRKRDEFLAERYDIYDGTDDMGEFVTTIPVKVDADLMALGRKKFEIYCAACHGYNGEGSDPANAPTRGSMVGRRWSIPVPNLHDPKYLTGGEFGADGYIFTVARKGVRTMPPYGHALDTHDAWAVVAYVRALQASHLGSLADVPEAERAALGSPPAAPAPETPAPESPAAPAEEQP